MCSLQVSSQIHLVKESMFNCSSLLLAASQFCCARLSYVWSKNDLHHCWEQATIKVSISIFQKLRFVDYAHAIRLTCLVTMCTMCVPCVCLLPQRPQRPEKVSDPLNLEWQTVVTYQRSVGNQTQEQTLPFTALTSHLFCPTTLSIPVFMSMVMQNSFRGLIGRLCFMRSEPPRLAKEEQ